MPAAFCADCFRGTLRGDISPTGTEENIQGHNVYVARPAEGKRPIGLVVIITDVFGWSTPNIRGLADSYARRGPFLVYVPDFLDDNACNPEFFSWIDGVKTAAPDWYTLLVMKPWWIWKMLAEFIPFAWRCRETVAKPRIFGFFNALRQSPPPPEFDPESDEPLQLGAVGFCWGGKYTILLAQETPSRPQEGNKPSTLIDCAFTAHPSLVRVPSHVKNVQVPLSVASGDGDEWMGAKKTKEMTQILEEQGKHEVVIYPGAIHGFAVRGDPKDPKQSEYALQAEDQAVRWLHKHLYMT